MNAFNEGDRLVSRLMDKTVDTLRVEYDLQLEESARARSMLFEAADILRQNFKDVDEVVRANLAEGSPELEKYQSAYRQIIATLQFEDIVTQIIGHQMERAESTSEILVRMEQVLQEVAAGCACEETLNRLQEEIESCLARFSGTESVQQQDLAAGEAELF